MKKPIVVAGNYGQFRDWCRESGTAPGQAVYVSSPESLYGRIFRAEDVIEVGDYYRRKDYHAIRDAILTCARHGETPS